MQAALMLRSKERMQRRRELRRKGGGEIPSNKITKDIPPYPRYPPESWVKMFYFILKLNIIEKS